MNLFSILTKPFSWLSGDIAIDLGTANTLIWLRGKGVIINEPSIVARSVHDEKIFAVGNEAKEMVGKTHKGIETIRPLRDGVIADFNMTDGMLQGFIRKVELNRIARVRMVICVPSGVTDVERRAVKDSGERANAKEVFLIEEPVAAAIGIGLDISRPIGNIIVDIGGGTTEIAVISLNGVATKESIRIAGDEMDEAIVQWFRNEHKLEIGLPTSESIKKTVGSAMRMKPETISVKGGEDNPLRVRISRHGPIINDVLESVEKTGRLVVVDPAHQSCSVASEISSIVAQEGFWSLQAPIQRVASLDCHFPFSPALEKYVFPNEEDIEQAVFTTLE